MAAVAPIAIILGIIATLAVVLRPIERGFWMRAGSFGKRFETDLEMAGMQVEPQQYGLILIGVAVALWTLLIVLLRPNPLIGIALAVVVGALTFVGSRGYLRFRRQKRVANFQDQLENALRTLAGGVRVGLGIRQAFIMTAEQSPDPVRTEFTRVVGLSNVGVGLLDAFDQMAIRMTNPETAMLSRVLRVQAQTGGDLAGTLEGLANTIRDRRRLRRKVSAIVAQGRATGWLLGLLPLGLGAFLIVTEPALRDAMLNTLLGRIFFSIALVLDGLAVFTLMKIVQIDP